MLAMICEPDKWQVVHDLEPGGDEPYPLYVRGCVQFSETGWNATLTEIPDSGIVGRAYPITLELTIFESGPHEPGSNLLNVGWDGSEALLVDKILVTSPLLEEAMVLIPICPE